MNNDGIIKDLERMLDEMTTYSNNITQKCTKLTTLIREYCDEDEIDYESYDELGINIRSNEDLINFLKTISNRALKNVSVLRLIFIRLRCILETEMIISEETSNTIKVYMDNYEKLKKINYQVVLCLVKIYASLQFGDEESFDDAPSL